MVTQPRILLLFPGTSPNWYSPREVQWLSGVLCIRVLGYTQAAYVRRHAAGLRNVGEPIEAGWCEVRVER
jgi:hypothetical protein